MSFSTSVDFQIFLYRVPEIQWGDPFPNAFKLSFELLKCIHMYLERLKILNLEACVLILLLLLLLSNIENTYRINMIIISTINTLSSVSFSWNLSQFQNIAFLRGVQILFVRMQIFLGGRKICKFI